MLDLLQFVHLTGSMAIKLIKYLKLLYLNLKYPYNGIKKKDLELEIIINETNLKNSKKKKKFLYWLLKKK